MAMDELEISGKRYISTRRAAREHGYHSDYMGQLIRAGKVAGQKVGRAWYIDEGSLTAYFSGEQKPAEPVAEKETPVEAPIEVAAPAPVPASVPVSVPEVVVEEVQAKEDPAPHADDLPKEEPVAVAQEIKPAEVPEEKVVVKKIEEPEEIFSEVQSTRVPIRAPISMETGGLRYMVDDSPSLPTVTRTAQVQVQRHVVAPTSATGVAHSAPRKSFPIISLSIVALLAIVAATFAATFMSTAIVSEPGKSAIVQYVIHW